MFPAASRKPPSTPMNSSSHERAPMCVQGDSGLVLTTDPKPRLRWTAELHDRFVDAVNQLGGPDKATPKTIMRVMGVKGLTLYHLKSHLQVQKHLQIRIEAQGKYMQSILEKAYQTLAAGQGTEAAGEQLGFVHDMADLQLFGGTGDLQLDNSHQLHLGSIHHLQPPDHGLYLTASPALIGKKMIMAGEKSPFIWDDEAEDDDDSQLHNIGIDVAPGVIDGGYEAKPTIPNADDDKLVLEGTAKMDRPSPLRVLNHPLSVEAINGMLINNRSCSIRGAFMLLPFVLDIVELKWPINAPDAVRREWLISCCFIEFASLIGSRFDFDRYGLVPRSSPRQADLILTADTVTMKMAPSLVRLYEQMPKPKYVISMGACTITGGMFSTDSYSTVRGVDKLIPVDVYLPGCPPKPEAIIDAITKLRKKISREILEDRTVSQQENRCFTTNHKFYVRRSIHTGNYDQELLYKSASTSEIPSKTFFQSKSSVSPPELVNQER
ncbi:hypothetical protein ZIOFF_013331 [Zingiber officinale]|uniref:HTH myb-type domain-containing protein n=1 Tax=Zingiber officinale TaxID=94328 RepID=A0A8J5LKT4_ZINOF|nr:hypothetical protein ZIOFF_013331 [Zingiber officinale]